MRIFFSGLVLTLLSFATARADELPTITTLADLRAQPMKHLASGWDVRIGMANPGKEAGPFVLIYADVQSRNPTELAHDRDPREWLGPLFVRTQWDGIRAELQRIDTARAEIPSGLYAISIPTHTGTCHITIDDGTQTLWETKVVIGEVPASPWQPFVGFSEMLSKADEPRASDLSLAVIPKIPGDQPLLNFDNFAADHKDADALLKRSLPLTMPPAPEWLPSVSGAKAGTQPLQLAIDHERFTLVADGRKMLDWPDKCLLARWWVNDKPAIPEMGDWNVREWRGRKISVTDKFTVAFGYPESLHAKEGDALALQVLYNSAGFEQAASGASAQLREAIMLKSSLPMLSNRLEFRLTKELIAARDKNAAK